MANELKGEVDVKIGGKTYTVVLTSNALVQVKSVLGIADTQHLNMADVEHMRGLLWAGLLRHHEGVDLMTAGDLLDEIEGGFEGAVEVLARALRFRLSGVAVAEPLGGQPAE
jgi:hypothetical protein